LYVLFPRESQGSGIKGSDGEYLGKPSPSEVLSLSVDWLPALSANTEEYPKPLQFYNFVLAKMVTVFNGMPYLLGMVFRVFQRQNQHLSPWQFAGNRFS